MECKLCPFFVFLDFMLVCIEFVDTCQICVSSPSKVHGRIPSQFGRYAWIAGQSRAIYIPQKRLSPSKLSFCNILFFPFLQFIPLFWTWSFSLISIPQIRDAILSIEVRRKFIMALASPFGRPVEADPVCILKHLYLGIKKWMVNDSPNLHLLCQIFCRKATFLAASGVFTFLVWCSLYYITQCIINLYLYLTFNCSKTYTMAKKLESRCFHIGYIPQNKNESFNMQSRC